jgi:hypothetical protein
MQGRWGRMGVPYFVKACCISGFVSSMFCTQILTLLSMHFHCKDTLKYDHKICKNILCCHIRKCLDPVLMRFCDDRSVASKGEKRARKYPDTHKALLFQYLFP